MQVNDRGTRLGGIDRLARDILGPEGQRIRHGRGVDSAGYGAGYDDFPRSAHSRLPKTPNASDRRHFVPGKARRRQRRQVPCYS